MQIAVCDDEKVYLDCLSRKIKGRSHNSAACGTVSYCIARLLHLRFPWINT